MLFLHRNVGPVAATILFAFSALSAAAQQPEPVWVPVSADGDREIDVRSLQIEQQVVMYLARYKPAAYVMRVQVRCREQLRAEGNQSSTMTAVVATTPFAKYPEDKQQESSFVCAFAQGQPQIVEAVRVAIANATVPGPPPALTPNPEAVTSPLDLYCRAENLERNCSEIRSVDGYRFVRDVRHSEPTEWRLRRIHRRHQPSFCHPRVLRRGHSPADSPSNHRARGCS